MSEETKEGPEETESGKEEEEGNMLQNQWMIKPCKSYLEEYKDCRSFKARFNQYFVHGHALECGQWRRDYDNCVRWTEKNHIKSGNELVKSETARRLERLRAHYKNDVWEKREHPPEQWSSPLPEHISKDYPNSYLDMKSKQLKGELPPDAFVFGENLPSFSCTIL